MNKFPQFIVAICVVAFSSVCFSQSGYAKIDKNRNIQAKGLYHDLNKTKDTLILKSNKKINYLYTANKDGKHDINKRIDNTEFKLPLNQLDKGRNVFVAIQSPMRIVFVVHVLKDIPKVERITVAKNATPTSGMKP